MIDNNASETISNIVTYNSYYGLFLTYVFPILLLVLIVFAIGYLASINKKLNNLYSKTSENKNIETLDTIENNNNKTLYEATVIPAVIISGLIIFLVVIALIFSFD